MSLRRLEAAENRVARPFAFVEPHANIRHDNQVVALGPILSQIAFDFEKKSPGAGRDRAPRFRETAG
jgi:hypothetical protein